jgi:DNA-directed RNA polymerase specialized sigma24 family protein
MQEAFKSAVYEYSGELATVNASDAVSESARRLGDWRNLLTSEQAQVVELCHIDLLTQHEAAVRLGITRNAVKSRLLKAAAKLRKQQSGESINGCEQEFARHVGFVGV